MKDQYKDSAFIGCNAAYLEELEDVNSFNEHESIKSHVKHVLHSNLMPAQESDNVLRQYQILGSKFADINPLVKTENQLPKHDEYASIYCGKIAFDYMHINCPEKLAWWQDRIDNKKTWVVSEDKAKQAYTQLQQAEQMEHILSRKFVGQTRFSLEGCDALIPLVEELLNISVSEHDVKEIVLGMPHRGRLNIMQNVMGMKFSDLCDLYSGKRESVDSSSDVTYHIGCSVDRDFSGKTAHLSLAFNPSHLEFIVPVVMGSVRARQDSKKFANPDNVLPVVMHGDAAIAGQGVIAEWFNMMNTPANNIFGAIHIVVNNQLGFTTDNSVGRSGIHPTDAYKYADIPVVHVNADDIESVLYAAKCAADFRKKFKSSVIINLSGYRRFGHNEGDDPNFTQPAMYKKIKNHPSVLKLYESYLLDKKILEDKELQNISSRISDIYKQGKQTVNTKKTQEDNSWSRYIASIENKTPETKISKSKLVDYTKKLTEIPEGFKVHKQILKLLEEYKAAAEGEKSIRWGFAEQLAYASLLAEDYSIRLIGQDVERGTFSHRHAVWTDQENGTKYSPIGKFAKNSRAYFYNSTLSEQSVVGFEYGYSLVTPKTLVIWEAQYGDFCNGAQVIIDQFISSSWQKWERMSGLVMLLPHGYEGAGPEHSSARLERFLQLAGEENMRVCMPSNAAQIFHLLRMQMHQKSRVPLIIMSPKSSLRLPEAMSDIADFTHGKFENIIADSYVTNKSKITRVILCSGKVYYDLDKYRTEHDLDHVAIVRVEQLYPYDTNLCKKVLSSYKSLSEIVWCQEEPRNQGSWYNIRHSIEESSPKPSISITCVSRPKSASPAAGYKKLHQKRQKLVIENAFKEI